VPHYLHSVHSNCNYRSAVLGATHHRHIIAVCYLIFIIVYYW
jgi:hypothetical protein